jgi:PilZ domain-containing protein
MSVVESRFAVDKAVKFRVQGSVTWRLGRTRNLSRSGLLFACDQSLEVGAILELVLLDHDGRGQEIEGKLCLGEVVRRVLMDWPEVDLLIAVRFLEPGQQEMWREKSAS